MLFNSLEFLVFLPVVFFLYWAVFKNTSGSQNLLLLLASYVFYAWWDWRLLFLLIFSTLLVFYAGLIMSKAENESKRKWALRFGVVISIGLLCFFKYFNFFIETWIDAWSFLGIKFSPLVLNILLPVGISFYTFHGLSYLIDIYNQRIKATDNIVNYSLFVAYFPLLVAGPIERATHLLPQLEKRRVFSYKQGVEGLRLIVWGLFKKIVIADSLALPVNEIFANYTSQMSSDLILGAVYFAIQVYADFSGYTDVARGVSKLFGIELLLNFNFPYFSKSIPEFWHRWHISLSSWLNDYVYTPFALRYRNLKKWGIYLAVLFTFLISGFWHGAGWHFIVWGGLHGLYYFPTVILSGKRFKSFVGTKHGEDRLTFKDIPFVILTFSLVSFALIFFRSADITASLGYIQKLFTDLVIHPGQLFLLPKHYSSLIYVLLLIAIDLTKYMNWFMGKPVYRFYLHAAADIILIFTTISYLFRVDSASFIYFQF
jgi:D-alanyl-lipoteichoic acid acyltransferase DltB (MBOAT superfamily)